MRRNAPRPKAIPPRLRTPAKIPTGPRQFRQPKKPRVSGGPGDPPPGFIDPALHGSRSEWPIYWALAKIFEHPLDPRQFPYIGGPPFWTYQEWYLGGRSESGGAVGDFAVRSGSGGPDTILRVQSYKFHLAAGPDIASFDDLQRQMLSGDATVIDLYEQDFLHLEAPDLIIYVKSALGMIQAQDPRTAGTVRRP